MMLCFCAKPQNHSMMLYASCLKQCRTILAIICPHLHNKMSQLASFWAVIQRDISISGGTILPQALSWDQMFQFVFDYQGIEATWDSLMVMSPLCGTDRRMKHWWNRCLICMQDVAP